jgi:hypothetical protein
MNSSLKSLIFWLLVVAAAGGLYYYANVQRSAAEQGTGAPR